LTVGNNFVQLTILGKTLKIPSKSTFETRIAVKQNMQQVEKSASSLIISKRLLDMLKSMGWK
jgi:hypothetical protein